MENAVGLKPECILKHSHFSCPIQSKAEKKQALQFELNRLKIHSVVVRLASRLGTQTAT